MKHRAPPPATTFDVFGPMTGHCNRSAELCSNQQTDRDGLRTSRKGTYSMQLTRWKTISGVVAVFTAVCLPLSVQAGTINIILSDMDVIYSGANFGGTVQDIVAHTGGDLDPAEADLVKAAVFEMDMNEVGTIMSGDVGYGQMHGDLKIDGVGTSLDSVSPNNFHIGIGSNGGGFGFDWFTTVGGYNLQLGIDSIDLLISSGVFFFTGSASVLGQNLPFGLVFDPNLPVQFSYTATLPGLSGPANARTGAMASGALTISGTMLIPEPATAGLLGIGVAFLGATFVRRRRHVSNGQGFRRDA